MRILLNTLENYPIFEIFKPREKSKTSGYAGRNPGKTYKNILP